MRIKTNRGFSLFELLATLLITSIALGLTSYFVINIIESSKDKSNILIINSFRDIAKIYANDYQDEVVWKNVDDITKNEYTCIPIQTLINKGYLTNKDLNFFRENSEDNSLKFSNFVILTRNEYKKIIEEKLDKNNETCGNNQITNKVEIPTASKYCSNPTYSNASQSLIKSEVDTPGFSFDSNTTQAIDAGAYMVTAKIDDGLTWADDSKEQIKNIQCSIKKKKPTLILSSYGEIGTDFEDSSITVVSSDVNGILSLKTSNKNIATAEIIIENKITKGIEKNIIIKKLGTRKAITYITITLTPEDKKNYYSNSAIYTVGEIDKIEQVIPTNADICKNPGYNAQSQEVFNQPTKDDHYMVFQTGDAIEIRDDYEVIVKLKYGAFWKNVEEDEKYKDRIYKCSIISPEVMAKYDNNNGSGCTSKKVTYLQKYGDLCTPTRTGYSFEKWVDSNGNTINKDSQVTRYVDHTLTARWIPNKYVVTYDSDGGNDCSPKTKKVTYDSKYGDLCTPTKTGYTFVKWVDDNGNTISSNTKVSKTSDHTLTAKWDATKYTLTYDSNGGNDCSPKTKKVTYDSKYGDLCTPTKTGYTFVKWVDNNGNTISSNTKVSKTSDHILTANWRVNVCTITYKPNGGKFTAGTDKTVQKLNYTGESSSTSNMRNAIGGTFKATRSDDYSKAVSKKEWIRNDGTTFNQDSGYSATDFCPNLGSGDQSVNLYVNWYATKYRKKICKTCKTCTTSTEKKCNSGYYQCVWGCAQKGTQGYTQQYSTGDTKGECKNPFPNWCAIENEYYVCSNYTTISNKSANCSKCGCKTWNSWSDYIYDSCTKNSKTQCESSSVYPNPRYKD